MSKKNAIWYGGLTGSFFLTIIEVLDGFSKEWGASFGDLLANSAGAFLAIGQALRWDEQRIQLKYSYFPSEWAEYNPSQLGSGNIERALKDYNGQSYWLSFNIKSLFNISSSDFGSFLNNPKNSFSNPSLLTQLFETQLNSFEITSICLSTS